MSNGKIVTNSQGIEKIFFRDDILVLSSGSVLYTNDSARGEHDMCELFQVTLPACEIRVGIRTIAATIHASSHPKLLTMRRRTNTLNIVAPKAMAANIRHT
jgi:hypothetical protein